MAGRRWRAASAMIRSLAIRLGLPDRLRRPPFGSFANASMARSTSAPPSTIAGTTCTASADAAACVPPQQSQRSKIARLTDDQHPADHGCRLLEHPEPPTADRELVVSEAREIPAWPGHVVDKPTRSWIGCRQEHHRCSAGFELKRLSHARAGHDDDGGHRTYELDRHGMHALDGYAAPMFVDVHILTVDPAEFLEAFAERLTSRLLLR